MDIKTIALNGQALDWAVAKCENRSVSSFLGGGVWVKGRHEDGRELDGFDFVFKCTDWLIGGPIIESEGISIVRCEDDYTNIGLTDKPSAPVWAAEHGGGHSPQSNYEGEQYEPCYEISEDSCFYGETPLIAAMRCFVARKLGDIVDIPDELVEQPVSKPFSPKM